MPPFGSTSSPNITGMTTRPHERAVRSQQYLYIRNAFPSLPGTPPADAVRSITFQAMRALRDEGKLPPKQMGCFVTPGADEELYDVQADPYQLRNLAGDATYAATLVRMRRVHEEWCRGTNDEVPQAPTPDKFDRETGVHL